MRIAQVNGILIEAVEHRRMVGIEGFVISCHVYNYRRVYACVLFLEIGQVAN